MEVFGDTFVPPGLQNVWARSQHCPRCVQPFLRPVVSVDDTRWFCPSCGKCWRVQHGRLRPVDPVTCRGCASHSRGDCIRLLQRECPRFGAGAPSEDDFVGA
jgi:hypothetical protein